MYNGMDKKWKILWQKEKLLVLSNFFFCHYVFKKPSAAEASKSVYMRERVTKYIVQKGEIAHFPAVAFPETLTKIHGKSPKYSDTFSGIL